MARIFEPTSNNTSMIRDYEQLLKIEEWRLKEMADKPYNSTTRDCENRIKKYKEEIKKLWRTL